MCECVDVDVRVCWHSGAEQVRSTGAVGRQEPRHPHEAVVAVQLVVSQQRPRQQELAARRRAYTRSCTVSLSMSVLSSKLNL